MIICDFCGAGSNDVDRLVASGGMNNGLSVHICNFCADSVVEIMDDAIEGGGSPNKCLDCGFPISEPFVRCLSCNGEIK